MTPTTIMENYKQILEQQSEALQKDVDSYQMSDYVSNPRLRQCDQCKCETVQDVSKYTSFPGH